MSSMLKNCASHFCKLYLYLCLANYYLTNCIYLANCTHSSCKLPSHKQSSCKLSSSKLSSCKLSSFRILRRLERPIGARHALLTCTHLWTPSIEGLYISWWGLESSLRLVLSSYLAMYVFPILVIMFIHMSSMLKNCASHFCKLYLYLYLANCYLANCIHLANCHLANCYLANCVFSFNVSPWSMVLLLVEGRWIWGVSPRSGLTLTDFLPRR